jgi:deoxyribonuclease-4
VTGVASRPMPHPAPHPAAEHPAPATGLGPLGAHVSAAGGVSEAAARAKAIGATAMQIFTKQASRWAERVCADDECVAFRAGIAATEVRRIAAHDSYLINLASPDPVLHARSLASFIAELRRSEALSIDYIVSHPGNYMDDRASGLARNIDAIAAALEQAPGRVRVLMETTAGAGTGLGATFEEIAALAEGVPRSLRDRMGVCADTCHVFAAGYDLAGDYEGVWARFGDVVGFGRLHMMHLNDSKFGLGTHRDRHELIGEGHLGEGVFRRLMTDPRLAAIPKVIETPKGDEPAVTDARMLTRLRSYAADG